MTIDDEPGRWRGVGVTEHVLTQNHIVALQESNKRDKETKGLKIASISTPLQVWMRE